MLLIDGDLLVFKAAAYWEDKFSWEEGGDEVVDSHIDEAMSKINDDLESHCEFCNDQEHKIVFSDSENFRKKLNPNYKAHRDPKRIPASFGAIKERLKKEHEVVQWDNLEADDVLGILCTRNVAWIVVTEDKDQATVPGWWYNNRHPELGIRNISKKEADHNHLLQTMTGDSSDGYKGIPRVGPKGAANILAQAKEDFIRPWIAVLMAYMEKGLTKEDALMNARMAYILRDGDYNEETGEVRLWEPFGRTDNATVQ